METFLIILLILLLLGAFPAYNQWGWAGPSPIALLALIIILILVLKPSLVYGMELMQQVPQVIVQPVIKIDPPAILAIGGVTATVTQLIKLGTSIPDKWGLWICLLISVLTVIGWGFSNETAWSPALVWPYMTAIISTWSTAIGIFGIVRAVNPADPQRTTRAPSSASGFKG